MSESVAETPRQPLVPSPETLGSAAFRAAHGVRYAYVSGAMYRGIASADLVIAMGQAGFLGFLGTGGLSVAEIESAVTRIQTTLGAEAPWGANMLHNLADPALEEATVDLYQRLGVRTIEASAYMSLTPALVRYRVSGLETGPDGKPVARNRIMAKVSRPEIAEHFLTPPPAKMIERLMVARAITPAQARLSRQMPMADDITVEADSGGHTDQGMPFAILPGIIALRDRIAADRPNAPRVRVGAAGGLGAPAAIAAAFVLGADYVTTGLINQCTVEAGTSDAAKDMLATMDTGDTTYCVAGDMFELGAKVQVLKKGVFFPARANKLHELYLRHASLDEIDPKTRAQIEETTFGRSLDTVWEETRTYLAEAAPDMLAKAEQSEKTRMAMVFRWYFAHSTRAAMAGDADATTDFQIHTGPALGAFNQWVRGTPLEPWRERHVADIALRLMQGAAEHLGRFATTAHPIA